MTTIIIDTQEKIKKLIKAETINLYFYCFFPFLLILPRLLKKEIYNSTLIIGLFLFFIPYVCLSILTIRRKKILKSINLTSDTIADTVIILTSFKKHYRRFLNFLWGSLCLIGFYMIIWDDINTDLGNGLYLFIAISTLISLLILLLIILLTKNPVDRIIDDLNSLEESK